MSLSLAFTLSFATLSMIAAGADIDRSPVDLVLSSDETWLATVNQTSDTVSLVDAVDGKLLDEIAIGHRPTGIALHPDGNRILATSSFSGDLHVLEVVRQQLTNVATIPLGFQPHGVVIAPDGRFAYVALTDADQVAVVDLEAKKVLDRMDVGRWPRYLALSVDGRRLAVGTSGDRGITVVDTETRKLVQVDRFVGLNIGHLRVSREGDHVYFPWMVYRRNPISEGNIRLGWVLASRLGRKQLGEASRREAISLDPPRKAVADPHGLGLTSDERYVVISASGTHELLVFAIPDLPFQDRGSTDHIDEQLLKDDSRFYRIELGGRPMGLTISRDDRTVYVANYLDNSIQVVDLSKRTLEKRIPLGGSVTPSLARQGEAIFYDARRSLDQWYSCHSCHYDGATNSVTMDTVNDGSQFTFKTVLPLYHIDKTGPWTWHGWQKELTAAMKHSLETTMLGPPPSEADAEALVAYLRSLELPPNPWREVSGALSAAALRGEKIFNGAKGGCAACHRGSHFTDGEIHDLDLEMKANARRGFNTPTLNGVFRKVLLMHDGRSSSIGDLLRGPHAPHSVEGSQLDEEELNDLIEFVKAL